MLRVLASYQSAVSGRDDLLVLLAVRLLVDGAVDDAVKLLRLEQSSELLTPCALVAVGPMRLFDEALQIVVIVVIDSSA